jgi:hypothetical protein
MAIMSMPEAAVNEYHASPAGEHNIWGSRHILSVEAETVSQAVEHGTHQYLRRGIAAADTGHDPASLLR